MSGGSLKTTRETENVVTKKGSSKPPTTKKATTKKVRPAYPRVVPLITQLEFKQLWCILDHILDNGSVEEEVREDYEELRAKLAIRGGIK
jgi:hypothetical protein